MNIQKIVIFFLIIGSVAFIYFSYMNLISKSLKDNAESTPTQTADILKRQSDEIKRLNKDYRDIIEQSKRQSLEAAREFDHDAIRRDYEQALKDNRRQMDDNRRQMEQLRRDMQRR